MLKNWLTIQHLHLSCLCWLAKQLAGYLPLTSGRRRLPGSGDHNSSPRSPPGRVRVKKKRKKREEILTFCACFVGSMLSFHSTGLRCEPCLPFSQICHYCRVNGRRRGGGGWMVFTMVAMSTASQKSLLINTESTWCKYERGPTVYGKIMVFMI